MEAHSSSYLFNEYSNRIEKLVVFRFIVSIFFFVTLIFQNWLPETIMKGMAFIACLLIFNTLIFFFLKKIKKHNLFKIIKLSKIQCLFDFVVVTIFIFYTGGVKSNFIGLYLANYLLSFYIIYEFKPISLISFSGPLLFIIFAVLEKLKFFSLTSFLLNKSGYPELTWFEIFKSILFVLIISAIAIIIMVQIINNLKDKLNRLEGVNNRLSALYNVSASFDKMFEAEHLVESVIKVIEMKLGFSSICLFFKIPGEKEWVYNCNDDDFYDCFDTFDEVNQPDDFFKKNFIANKTYLIFEPKEFNSLFKANTDKTVAFIPVVIRSSVRGFLIVGTKKQDLIIEENMILLAAIANQVGAIEENLKFFDIVQKGKKQWQNTFDALKDFILVIDKEGRIIRANKAFIKALNTSYPDIIGENAKRILKIEKEIIIPNTTDKPITKEIQFPHIDGTYLISLYPIYAEDKIHIDGGVYVISDVTALKRAERNALKHLKEKEKLNIELKDMFNGIIMLTASAIDAKSEWTAGHSERVSFYAVKIAKKMGLSEEDIENIRISSLLHDIGKIAIPDNILNKGAKLLNEEFELIKKHPIVGARILSSLSHFEKIIPGIKHHHERWDGNGYPYGLNSKDIPLYARILGVADAYDAMVSKRPYREGLPYEIALEEIVRNSGTQFDPDIVSYFIVVLHEEYNNEDDNQQIDIA